MATLGIMLPVLATLCCLIGMALGQTTQASQSILSGFSDAEIACFGEKKILYEGNCHTLLNKGPCPDEHRLVLDIDDAVNDTGPLVPRPVCKHCQCCSKPSAILWHADGKCHNKIQEKTKLCPLAGTEPANDYFGVGNCSCVSEPPHLRPVGIIDGPCYELYKKAPCVGRDIFVPSALNRNVGHCERNLCSTRSKSTNKPHVMYEGQCYELGGPKPCTGNQKLVISSATLKPTCFTSGLSIFDVPTRNDPQEIRLAEEEKVNYALQLINGACNKRPRRGNANAVAKRGGCYKK